MDILSRHRKQLRSQATARPFTTAIRALAVGCLLLCIAVLLHDQSPVTRLLAERGAAVEHNGGMNPTSASQIEDDFAIAAHAPSGRTLSAERETVTDSPTQSDGLVERPPGDDQHFWNASQSARKSGPAIRLGTPLADENAFDRDKTRSPVGDEPGDRSSLVTRTYRPTSMSAASLERLVRPLLTARGQTIASTAASAVGSSDGSPVERSRASSEADSDERAGTLIVTDRAEAIGRVDALCSDLESASPRIAIDLAVASVAPAAGCPIPLDQWRAAFGIVDADLPSVLKQIRALGCTRLRESRQLQATSGTWIDLEWSATGVAAAVGPDSTSNLAQPENERAGPFAAPSPASPIAETTLRIRPSVQSDGAIRVEVRAQSSRVEAHAHDERPQLATVRFNTQVVLREGATGVINLFGDEPSSTGSIPRAPNHSAAAGMLIPGGPTIPAAKIVPQPGASEQTLLFLMPRIAGPAHAVGRIAGSSSRDPA